MIHLKMGLMSLLMAGMVASWPVSAQTKSDGSCIADGKGGAAGESNTKCKGGPLQPGDQRLGGAKVPRTADRKISPRNSFEIGGTSITVSGSVRVDSTFSK